MVRFRLRAAVQVWIPNVGFDHKRPSAEQEPKRPLDHADRPLDRGRPDQGSGTTAHAKHELAFPNLTRQP